MFTPPYSLEVKVRKPMDAQKKDLDKNRNTRNFTLLG